MTATSIGFEPVTLGIFLLNLGVPVEARLFLNYFQVIGLTRVFVTKNAV